MKMKYWFKNSLVRSLVLVTVSLLFTGTSAAQTDNVVKLGHVPGWTGLTVKNEVISQVLGHLGYEAELFQASLPLVYRGVASGEIDAFAAVWIPSSQSMIQPYYEEGTITRLATHLDGALYGSAVPDYVCEAGVRSFADLNDHADRFNERYYGLEPGNDGNELIRKAIADDTYGLGDWQLVESSISAMLTQVESEIEDEEWIVFSGWKPHWMNVVYDLCYLEDPKNIWGGPSQVDTIANSVFVENSPNVARLLTQFQIESAVQSDWILQYGFEDRPQDEVAAEWLGNNLGIVETWLEGVTTVDGEPATEAIREAVRK